MSNYTSITRTRWAEVALGIYKTFLIYRTCMRRAPAKPVRACTLRKWCLSHVTFEAPLRTSHFSLQSSHSTLHTSHSTLHTEHPITTHTHTQAHPKQLEATVTMRQKKKGKRPQPHPPRRRGTFHRRLQPLYTEKTQVSCSGFLPSTKPMQHSCSHYTAFRSITSQTCTCIHTWQYQMTTVMQPFQCDLQPKIPKHPLTTHTQAHPKQLEATVTMRQKKGKATAAAPAAQTRYLSSPAAATLHGKTQGFVLRLPPQKKAHATFMQPLHCVSQHHVANLHVSTHITTPDDNSHAAIPKRSSATDSKTPFNYAHTQAHPKQLEVTVTMWPKKGKATAAAPAAQTRYLSSPAAATLHGKTQGFVLRLPPQHKAHATFMQPLHCVSQHHVANLHVSTHITTPDDNSHAAIPMRPATKDSKTPFNYAHTSTPKAA